jgi:hypothetical protein
MLIECKKRQVDIGGVESDYDLTALGSLIWKYLPQIPGSEYVVENLADREVPPRNTVHVLKFSIQGGESYLVKLVLAPDPESEYLPKIVSKYPGLMSDPNIMVPCILPVLPSDSTTPSHYLHIAPWIDIGVSLTHEIVRLWSDSKSHTLRNVLCHFGKFLRGFHSTYPRLQHTDMNPSNVLIVTSQEGTSNFVLIDCAGLDDQVGDDVGSFLKSLAVLAEGGFGEEFYNIASRAFIDGYNT